MKESVVALGMISASACMPAAAAPLQHIFGMIGTCEMLIVASEDYTNTCNPNIMQMIYEDGRSGFYIGIGSAERLFAFSGYQSERTGPSVKQTVDMFIFSPEEKGGEAYSVSVQGTCTYSKAYLDPARIICEATDSKDKNYRLEFLTIAGEPTVYR